MTSDQSIAFQEFRVAMIRELRDGYTEVTNEKVSLNEILRAFRRWCLVENKLFVGKTLKINVAEIEEICEKAFGYSRGKKEYSHLRVFYDEEDVNEFDALHQNQLLLHPDLLL